MRSGVCNFFFFSFYFLVNVQVSIALFRLQEQFAWSVLDYAYPSDDDRSEALATKKFIPENNLPVGIELWKNKLFITVPRWKSGVPSTLNYIPVNSTSISPSLIPYPDWASNKMGNCVLGLTTVYRIKADSCNRLWVLDVGTFGIGNTTQDLCPIALNIFNLTTNKKIRRYVLRQQDVNSQTFIANIAIDLVENKCDDAFAYMSDELGYGLIVYSWKENRSWRFSHSYFMPDPLAGDFNIDNRNFQWGTEGIFGMSLSPLTVTGDRTLYFSPLASYRGFAVSTKILRNSTNVEDSYHDFIALPERGPNSHITAQVISDSGVQIFNLIDRNAVGCWNSRRPYGPSYIALVDKDDTKLIFPSDVKIDIFDRVWVISDKMSTFLVSNLDYNDTNFRIFFAPLNVLISNTICQSTYLYSDFFK